MTYSERSSYIETRKQEAEELKQSWIRSAPAAKLKRNLLLRLKGHHREEKKPKEICDPDLRR